MFYLSKVLGDGVFKVVNTNGGIPVHAPDSGETTASYANKLFLWLDNMGFNRTFNNLEEKAVKSLVEYGVPVYGYSVNGRHRCYSDYEEVIKRYTASLKLAGLEGMTLCDDLQGLSLKKFDGGIKRLVVPKFIVSLGTNCCSGNNYIEEVEILNESLGCFAGASFYRCANLSRVTLGGFVDTIMPHAFRECGSLSKFIGDYRLIESCAFSRNDSLRAFEVSNKCTVIGRNVFERCTNLESVTFGDSLISIQDRAFSRCRSLRKITLPNSLEHLGRFVFDDCNSLMEVRLQDNEFFTRILDCKGFHGDVYINGKLT